LLLSLPWIDGRKAALHQSGVAMSGRFGASAPAEHRVGALNPLSASTRPWA